MRNEAVVLVLFFAHGYQTIGFQRTNNVFLERLFDGTPVFFGGKPDVEQDKAKLQLVFHPNLQHGAHPLVLGHQTGSLPFARFEITVFQGLPDQLKCHRKGEVTNVVQAGEQMEALPALPLL